MATVGNNRKFRKILAVTPDGALTATVKFDDGTVRIFDALAFRQGLKSTEFTAPLFDAEIFKRAEAKGGNLVWPNGFDLWGQDIYENSPPSANFG